MGTFRQIAIAGGLALIVVILVFNGGCRNQYMVKDESGRLVSPTMDPCAHRSTVFERSLCEAFSNQYDQEKVRLCLIRFLICDLARRHGPTSEPALVLRQLDGCDITLDSVRAHELLHRGMLELDFGWGPDSVTAMDAEIRDRAECILRFNCFNPEDTSHFDELGTLIARHGSCEIEKSGLKSRIVSFSDGQAYFFREDSSFTLRLVATAPSFDLLQVAMGKSCRRLGPGSCVEKQPGMKQAVQRANVDNRREIDIPVDYIPLDFAGVYCHILPTDSLGRPLNAQANGSAGPHWDYRSVYLDCFVNLDEFEDGHGRPPDSLIMDIEYTIERSPAEGAPLVSEKLPFRMPWPGMGNEGMIFRLCTKPIRSYADDTTNYELSVRADNRGKTMIHKFPFRVAPADYELVTAREGSDKDHAVPLCERKATARIGFKVDLLVPLVDIPATGAQGNHCCRLDLYLIPEKAPRPGKVTVSPSIPLRDSTDIPPGMVDSPALRAMSPYLISSREIRLTQVNAYSHQTVDIPRKYAHGGGTVRRGNYLLGGYVSVDGKYHSQVLMSRITLD